jgi:hypothetical protein
VVTVTPEALANSPSWKDGAENPPLAAKEAIKLANELKDTIAPELFNYKWHLTSANLQLLQERDAKWIWLICYESYWSGRGSGRIPNLQLAVLMDGTVVKPEITDR